jgi:predicted nucleic acid-binding protein
MTYLLDVNVLIAQMDTGHVQHNIAHDWFARDGLRAWATCPITENGALCIHGGAGALCLIG